MNNTLHMKLKSSVSTCLLAAAFISFSPHISLAGVCFLPDCNEELIGGTSPNPNPETKKCADEGYTYYASGECPKYYAKLSTCKWDEYYLKCDAKKWCDDNGYKTTSCSIPQYVNEQCPNGQPVYKNCKTDNARACRELGYTNSCPSGQKLKKNSGRCPYDSSYGTCCKPSGCPAYSSTNSSSYGTAGTDGCEYTCYYTCNINCPSGTSTSNPGGCGGSTKNGCGNKTCYYPYKACCTPYRDETGCDCGSTSCSDGCGGTRRCCKSCPPPSSSSSSGGSGSGGGSSSHNPDDCKSYFTVNGSSSPWCGPIHEEPQDKNNYPWCSYIKKCTTYGGSTKQVGSYNQIVGSGGSDSYCNANKPSSCPAP